MLDHCSPWRPLPVGRLHVAHQRQLAGCLGVAALDLEGTPTQPADLRGRPAAHERLEHAGVAMTEVLGDALSREKSLEGRCLQVRKVDERA